jgi:uncharacterized protein YjdB
MTVSRTRLALTAVMIGTGAITGCNPGGGTLAAPTCSVAAVAVTPNPASTTVGGTKIQMVATVTAAYCDALPLTWSSSMPSVATITNSGLVSGVAVGTTNITATAGNVTGTAAFAVNPASSPTASVAAGKVNQK